MLIARRTNTTPQGNTDQPKQEEQAILIAELRAAQTQLKLIKSKMNAEELELLEFKIGFDEFIKNYRDAKKKGGA